MFAHPRIQRRERLIQQQDLRIGGQRARDGHALLLAAGKLGRVTIGQMGQVHALQQRDGAQPGVPLPSQGVGHVLQRVQMGKEGVTLEDIPDVAMPGRHVAGSSGPAPAKERAAVQQDLARVGREQPGDDVQRRRLADAGRAEQHADLGAHLQTHRQPELRQMAFDVDAQSRRAGGRGSWRLRHLAHLLPVRRTGFSNFRTAHRLRKARTVNRATIALAWPYWRFCTAS